MHCSRRLIVQTLVFTRSYLHSQVSPPETLVVKGGTTWARNSQWILPENARLLCKIQGSSTCRKSTTWDKLLYFPSERRSAEDFFALKNPTASVGFEPANLGTKGQHATSRPPKPLDLQEYDVSMKRVVYFNGENRFHWNVGLHVTRSDRAANFVVINIRFPQGSGSLMTKWRSVPTSSRRHQIRDAENFRL